MKKTESQKNEKEKTERSKNTNTEVKNRRNIIQTDVLKTKRRTRQGD